MNIILNYVANPYIQAGLVIIGSILSAKLIDLVFSRILQQMTSKTKTDLDDRIISLLHKPIFYSLFFIGIAFAAELVDLPSRVFFLIIGLMKTFAVLIWAGTGLGLISLVLKWSAESKRNIRIIQTHTMPLFDNLGKIVIIAAASYFVLLSWNIDVTAWLASAGIIAMALGFAAKDTLANLFAGIFIMADAPYKIGDYINLDTGERGKVTDIGLRSTRILTRDDIQITIPNSAIAISKIVNESGGPAETERIRVTVGIAYGTDIDKARNILIQTAKSNPNICENPEPRVRFRSFDESQLTFQLLCWIELPVLRGRVLDQLNSEIYKSFTNEGIKIPFPQRTVHLVQNTKDDQKEPE